MPEGRGTLVGDLGQPLRIEILRDLPHDAHQLALPGGKLRRALLDEVQQVFLRIEGFRRGFLLGLGVLVQIGNVGVVVMLRETQSLSQAFPLAARRQSRRLLVAIHAVGRQCMTAVEDALDFAPAMTLLAIENEIAREGQVIENAVGLRELAKQVVALEKRVVPVGGMGHHQHLQRQRVGLHQVHQRRAGIDDDFVGEPAHPLLVRVLLAEQLLAEAPVRVVHRHADGRTQIDHLRRSDHFVLNWIGVELQAPCVGSECDVESLQQRYRPLCAGRDRRGHATGSRSGHRYPGLRHQPGPGPLGCDACERPCGRIERCKVPGIHGSARSVRDSGARPRFDCDLMPPSPCARRAPAGRARYRACHAPCASQIRRRRRSRNTATGRTVG